MQCWYHLKDKRIFSLTAPAKIQAYMASSKPILAMINGEGANLIEEAACGFVCNAGDFQSLSMNVLKFAELSEVQRAEKGRNGYNYYNTFFSKQKAMDSLLNLFNN